MIDDSDDDDDDDDADGDDDDDDDDAKPGEDGHAKPDQGPVLREPLQGDDVELPGRAVRQQGADLCQWY